MLRVVMIPVVLWLLHDGRPVMNFWAAIVYALAVITDALDGWLARRQGLESVLGKFLDPLADKLIVMATLVFMVDMGRVPAWAVVVKGPAIVAPMNTAIARGIGARTRANIFGTFLVQLRGRPPRANPSLERLIHCSCTRDESSGARRTRLALPQARAPVPTPCSTRFTVCSPSVDMRATRHARCDTSALVV